MLFWHAKLSVLDVRSEIKMDEFQNKILCPIEAVV